MPDTSAVTNCVGHEKRKKLNDKRHKRIMDKFVDMVLI